jgi:hypothetical protein
MFTTGHFGHYDENDRWQQNLPVPVPRCCIKCRFFDGGETGDYGEQLSPPYCKKNVPRFPTKTNKCGKFEPNGWGKAQPYQVGESVKPDGFSLDLLAQTYDFRFPSFFYGKPGVIETKAEPPFVWDVMFHDFGRIRVYEDEIRRL